MSLYFNRHGFNRSAPSTTHFMRCTVRVYGFASINAPHSGGVFLTKPLNFEGQGLEVNYETSATGSIGVELQDASGQPIEGFRLEESDLLIGDEVSKPVTWGRSGDVSALQERPVRILFKMKDADLYSFRFASM